MASGTINFNFKPVSINIVTTGSYTIPAGQYAYVTACVRNGADFQISSNVVLKSTTWSNLGFGATLYKSVGSPGTLSVAAEPGALMSQVMDSSNATTTATEAIYTAATADMALTANYWLPTGTSIAVSGADAEAVCSLFTG